MCAYNLSLPALSVLCSVRMAVLIPAMTPAATALSLVINRCSGKGKNRANVSDISSKHSLSCQLSCQTAVKPCVFITGFSEPDTARPLSGSLLSVPLHMETVSG